MIEVSSSIIKELYPRGEENNICPRQFHAFYIARTHEHSDRLAWMKGRYFESQLIGTARDGVVDDLPRDQRNGKKTIDHQRIDDQVLVAKQTFKFYNIEVNEHNVQVVLRMPYSDHYVLKGTLDIFPTTVLDTETGALIPAIVDVKLTEDVESKWGDFCWGAPTYMDHTQALHYSYLVENIDNPLNDITSYPPELVNMCKEGLVDFFYFVFGYKKNKGFRNPIRITNKDKRNEYLETLRKVMSKLEMMKNQGWPPERDADRCPTCPIADCEMKRAILNV